MDDKLPWNEQDLELIREKLDLPLILRAKKSAPDYRADALARYNSRFKEETAVPILESVKSEPRPDFDKRGLDLLAVRLIRHRLTNYADFCLPKPRTALNNLVWLIGFLKASNKIGLAYPELASAVSYETIKRVSREDRILLRQTMIDLADTTSVEMPIQTYAELQASVVKSLNRQGRRKDPEGVRLDIANLDAKDTEVINTEIVSRFIDRTQPLGRAVLDPYNHSVVRERICGNALTSLGEQYPELREVCQRHIDGLQQKTATLTHIAFTKEDTKIFGSSLKRVYNKVIMDYNARFAAAINEGSEARLYLEGASDATLSIVRALAVWTLLSKFSRYDEFMVTAESMAEPSASIQKHRVRELFLARIQEHYPELTGAVQAELRLLHPEPELATAS